MDKGNLHITNCNSKEELRQTEPIEGVLFTGTCYWGAIVSYPSHENINERYVNIKFGKPTKTERENYIKSKIQTI